MAAVTYSGCPVTAGPSVVGEDDFFDTGLSHVTCAKVQAVGYQMEGGQGQEATKRHLLVADTEV